MYYIRYQKSAPFNKGLMYPYDPDIIFTVTKRKNAEELASKAPIRRGSLVEVFDAQTREVILVRNG